MRVQRPAPRPAAQHTQAPAATSRTAPTASPTPASGAAAPAAKRQSSAPARNGEDVRGGASSRASLADVQAQQRAASVSGANAPVAANAPSLDAVRAGGVMRRGQSGESVRTAQGLLNDHGHPAPTDGRYGPSTERAVGSFQADNGMEPTGRLDGSTLAALETPSTSSAARPDGTRLSGMGRGGDVPEAAGVYGRHGDTPLDLHDRAAVDQLITRSPQIDNDGHTVTDRERCGGAAVFNGLLMDGNPEANARAIRATASERHVSLSAEERSALDSMEAGHLTPREAARLQETTYRITDTYEPDAPGAEAGVTAPEMMATTAALRAHGGLAHTRSLSFHERVTGEDSAHWTVTSTTTGAPRTADSWPTPGDGHASVTRGGDPTSFRPGHPLTDDFGADIMMRPGDPDTYTLSSTHPGGDHVVRRDINMVSDGEGNFTPTPAGDLQFFNWYTGDPSAPPGT